MAINRIEQARQNAEEVSGLIERGQRVPRGLTESLRNDVRALIKIIEQPDKSASAPDR